MDGWMDKKEEKSGRKRAFYMASLRDNDLHAGRYKMPKVS